MLFKAHYIIGYRLLIQISNLYCLHNLHKIFINFDSIYTFLKAHDLLIYLLSPLPIYFNKYFVVIFFYSKSLIIPMNMPIHRNRYFHLVTIFYVFEQMLLLPPDLYLFSPFLKL
ncbi:MAG TPA: hypothetical protein DDW17_06840 [Deltaproteobacteria bacterium]|nr:hypothetical protein [Deltaproteobacteria bacterium]